MKKEDTILLRDPDEPRRAETRKALAEFVNCVLVDTVEEAQDILARETIHAIVVREVAGRADGVAFARAVQQRQDEVKIVLLAVDTDHNRLIEAFNESCLFRCLVEPVAPEALARAVRDAVRQFEMDRIQTLLVERATEIDRQVHSSFYRLYRLRALLLSLVRLFAGSVGLCVVAVIVLLLAGAGVFLLLYYLKSVLGFDLFPDKHLKDVFSP